MPARTMERRYKRGQVEWAIQEAHATRSRGSDQRVPRTVISNRIKRLLDLDRGLPIDPEVGAAHAFADAETASEGTGVDAEFTAFDALCLDVALSLLAMGFKQREVVTAIRSFRPHVQRDLGQVITHRPGRRQGSSYRAAASAAATTPDRRLFMVFDSLDMDRSGDKRGRPNGRGRKPLFCQGLDAIGRTAAGLSPRLPAGAVVVEISDTYQLIAAMLESAPQIRRGRQRGTIDT